MNAKPFRKQKQPPKISVIKKFKKNSLRGAAGNNTSPKKGYIQKPVKKPSLNAPRPDAPSVEPMQSAADGLRAVRQAINSLEGQHAKRLNEHLSQVYKHALLLRADEDEWLGFCREAEWEDFPGKPKVEDQRDALRFAVRFAVGFPSEKEEKPAATRRASKLAGVLKVLLDDCVQPKDVIDKLHTVGIEALSREAARRNKAPEVPTVWTLRFPDERSAKLLGAMIAGKSKRVILRLDNIDGLSVTASVRRIPLKSKATENR